MRKGSPECPTNPEGIATSSIHDVQRWLLGAHLEAHKVPISVLGPDTREEEEKDMGAVGSYPLLPGAKEKLEGVVAAAVRAGETHNTQEDDHAATTAQILELQAILIEVERLKGNKYIDKKQADIKLKPTRKEERALQTLSRHQLSDLDKSNGKLRKKFRQLPHHPGTEVVYQE